MSPFKKTKLGDHRGFYLDLNIKELLGIGKIDSAASYVRKLEHKT